MLTYICIASAILNVVLAFGVVEMKAQQREDNKIIDIRLKQLIEAKERGDHEQKRGDSWKRLCMGYSKQYFRGVRILKRVKAQARLWKDRFTSEKKHKEDAITKLMLSEAERYKGKTEALKMNRQAMAAAWLGKMGIQYEDPGTILPAPVLKYAMGERVKKLKEELKEAIDAWYRCDMNAFVDAMADISFAAECAGPLLGYDSNKAFRAVFESNMTKDPYKFSQDGKGKGAGFKAPDFSEALKKS